MSLSDHPVHRHSLTITPSQDGVVVLHDQLVELEVDNPSTVAVLPRSPSATAVAPASTAPEPISRQPSSTSMLKQVTLVVRLFIREACWSEFRKDLSLFLKKCDTEVPGHLGVSLVQEDDQDVTSLVTTPVDVDIITLDGTKSRTLVHTRVIDAIHTFASHNAMKMFLGSRLRNDWDVQLTQYAAKEPEFFSYSALTSFFALGRTFAPDGPTRVNESSQPPPKWKVGLVVLLVALACSFLFWWPCVLQIRITTRCEILVIFE
jgi:hypothetical protein